MATKNLPLYLKAQYKRAESFVRPWRENSVIQAAVAITSSLILISALFVFLWNLMGLFLASAIIIILLERVFGMKVLEHVQAF